VPLGRRPFLLGLLMCATLLLTACPQTEPAVVERIVRETVIVEVEKPIEVERIVEVTREVERIVEVTVTPTPPPEKEPVTLHVSLANPSLTLDPSLAADAISIDLLRNLYAGLTQVAPDGQVLPMLAARWEVSEDRRQYTFKLRDDGVWVKYDTGRGAIGQMRPITAQDVVFGVKRTLDPRTAADYAYVLDVIQGAEALRLSDIDGLSSEEQQTLLDGVGIEALDDTTVRITLQSPAPYFPAIFCGNGNTMTISCWRRTRTGGELAECRSIACTAPSSRSQPYHSPCTRLVVWMSCSHHLAKRRCCSAIRCSANSSTSLRATAPTTMVSRYTNLPWTAPWCAERCRRPSTARA